MCRTFALFLVVALAGCGGDNAPEDAATAIDAGADSGRCAPGALECECDEGSCTEGVCVMDVCSDCRVASEGCVCRSNGTCDTGLRCGETTELCETCPPGEEGCACSEPDATCGDGLECSGGLCVLDTCVDGSVDCPCRAGTPACDSGGICDTTGLCRACSTDMPGCPCESGACTGGLVCEADLCRDAVTCADLRAATCGEFQLCEESPGVDAVCVGGMCLPAYRWQSSDSTCVACVSADCTAEPTCAPGLPNTVDCATEHRDCVEVDGIGTCGGCATGYSDIGGVCVELGRCGSGFCAATEYCDTTRATGPTCTPWPCPSPNQVLDSSGVCTVTCTRSCAVAGSTGRYWPFSDEGDVCVCETVPGYYFDNGGVSLPVACDEDQDGWVRQEVRAILDRVPADPAIVANARCEVRAASVIELHDEYGNASRIESCDEGLLQDRTSGACTAFPLRLFESKRNDVAGEAARLGEAPPYASGGRRFRPEELNGLTKACVSELGDYDDDGFEDISQTQPIPVDTSTLSETARLRSFAHFLELYRTAWLPPAAGSFGTLTIQERSRCDLSFALGYGAPASYDPSIETTYWRNCERRRAPGYNADAALPLPGYDFGQWTCSNRSGSCAPETVPAHPTLFDPFPSLPTLVRDHGLCELGGTSPAGAVFRGMNHHSQFQCVQVVDDAPATPPTPYQRHRRSFGGTSRTTAGTAAAPSPATLTFNACQVSSCAGTPGCVDSLAPTGSAGVDAYDPVLSCSVAPAGTLPVSGTIGWAAVRYQTYGELDSTGAPLGDASYNGGCVNEQAEWPGLCPQSLFGVCNPGELDAFGRYCCYGCGDGCIYSHAGGVCRSGTCGLGTCDPGWGNCDSTESNGCENSLDSLTHCGTCGTACSRANAGESCAGDVCRITSCDVGFASCDTIDSTGCENTLDSLSNCGGCGVVCSLDNGGESCAGDVCRITTCDATWFDANALASDGCECRDTATNSSCGVASAMGAIAAGMTTTILRGTGRIPVNSTSTYDWFTVSFPEPVGGTPTIDFEVNPGSQYRFEVFVGACGAGMDCGGLGNNLTTWQFVDNNSFPGAGRFSSRSVSWPGVVFVRVHRLSAGSDCSEYTLRARRL